MTVIKFHTRKSDLEAELRMCRGEQCPRCWGMRVRLLRTNTSYDKHFECEDCLHLWSRGLIA